ncbi:MAG TPA: hypothetical protein VGX94_15875 [Terriglobia bacterium]|nr:hypothetical protein [Terriglobia bacterium]
MRKFLTPSLAFAFLAILLCARPSRAAEANRLTTAKIVYVEPMPGQLDQWFIQDLRAWGKYQIAGSEQGVDLVMRAQKPERKIHFTPHETPPVLHRQHKEPPILSVAVVDWVTGGLLWKADVLNISPKKNSTPGSGSEIEIDARHMKPDEIAQRCIDSLRRYVESLEQPRAAASDQGAKP